MTAKEEAINLYSKFLPYIDARFEIFSAKQCALIAVNLAIEYNDFHIEFLQEVKHEIEKL